MTHGNASRNSRTIFRLLTRAISCRSKKSIAIGARRAARLFASFADQNLFHEPLLFQPEQAIVRPGMRMLERRLVRQPDAMPALLINVKVERHTCLPQRFGEHQ